MESRPFVGVWLPPEILDHADLSCVEKILWADITSFTTRDMDWFKTDKAAAAFLGVGANTVGRAIAHMKQLGLIYQRHFDGRKRYLRSALDTCRILVAKGSLPQNGGSSLPQNGGSSLPQNGGVVNNEIYNEKKEKSRVKHPLPKIEYEPYVFLTERQYEKLVKAFGGEQTDDKIAHASTYFAEHPGKYKDHYLAIRKWLMKDERREQEDDFA